MGVITGGLLSVCARSHEPERVGNKYDWQNIKIHKTKYQNTKEQNGFNAHSLDMLTAFISRFDIYLDFLRAILLSRFGRNKIPYVGVHMQLDTCFFFVTINIFDL